MASLTELIAAAQHGDGEAYGRIVERFQDMAYYTAFRYLGEQQPAQDAAQDAFIEAYRCLPALESPLAFTAWFRRIIFKQCDRQARSRQPLHLDDDTWLALATDRPGPDQMLEQMQQRQAVRTAVQTLPEIYRQVTQRFYLHGRSMADIALDLDLPLSTIKKRLYTARQLLKERVKPMSAPTYHPSQDDTFSNRIRFFIALKHNDLTQAGQLVRRDPALLTVDPIRSYAARFENDDHKELANQAARLCKRYLDLQPIYQNQGLAGFDMPLYGDAERQAVIRARLLHYFLSQPLVVAESWSAVPGQYVPLAQTMQTTQAILAGAMDDVPEEEWPRLGQ